MHSLVDAFAFKMIVSGYVWWLLNNLDEYLPTGGIDRFHSKHEAVANARFG